MSYAFDGPYAGCYVNPGVAMDKRHVFIVHEILRGWPFKNALELGSFCGASSTAFVEAINRGSEMTATFCDIDITDSLRLVVSNCLHPHRARITNDHSWHVLESAENFDFVLVDANHDISSVTPEIERLVIRRPLCVMAHDTNATAAGYGYAEGAELLKKTFEGMAGYQCLEDCKDREGEQTKRGLFFATTDPDLYRFAATVFARLKD